MQSGRGGKRRKPAREAAQAGDLVQQLRVEALDTTSNVGDAQDDSHSSARAVLAHSLRRAAQHTPAHAELQELVRPFDAGEEGRTPLGCWSNGRLCWAWHG
jgi:hypothetical protein